MPIIWLRLQCSGKHSELLPDDLENDQLMIHNLLFSLLNGFSWFIAIAEVTLSYSHYHHLYTLDLWVVCYDGSNIALNESDYLQVTIEGLVAPALLELLGEIYSLEYPD